MLFNGVCAWSLLTRVAVQEECCEALPSVGVTPDTHWYQGWTCNSLISKAHSCACGLARSPPKETAPDSTRSMGGKRKDHILALKQEKFHFARRCTGMTAVARTVRPDGHLSP